MVRIMPTKIRSNLQLTSDIYVSSGDFSVQKSWSHDRYIDIDLSGYSTGHLGGDPTTPPCVLGIRLNSGTDPYMVCITNTPDSRSPRLQGYIPYLHTIMALISARAVSSAVKLRWRPIELFRRMSLYMTSMGAGNFLQKSLQSLASCSKLTIIESS